MSKQNPINHIAFVLDASSSMNRFSSDVIRVFDSQIKSLSKQSVDLNQETRVSVYSFADSTKNIIFDKDVMRLPSISDDYRPHGNTALIDATIKTIEDLQKTATLYGDHAFLVYVLTDGEENSSRNTVQSLSKLTTSLPDNWTIAVLVPNVLGVQYAKRVGFQPGNIMQWDTTSEGFEKAAEKISTATANYMAMRSTGSRGTSTLFAVDTSNLKSEQVNRKLDSLSVDKYRIFYVDSESAIRPFVESHGLPYIKGNSFYQLTKKEEVQDYKQVCIQNKISGYVYTGQEARDLLGLPNTTVNVAPEAGSSKFEIFIQSTSVNRKLKAGTKLLVLL